MDCSTQKLEPGSTSGASPVCSESHCQMHWRLSQLYYGLSHWKWIKKLCFCHSVRFGVNPALMWGRQCSEWGPLKAMQTEKTATLFSLHPSYPFSPAGVNLRLGGLRSWAKWMTTPGHHHPHFSPVVNVYWLCTTSQDDSVHSGSVVLWFSLYILVYFLFLLLILLLICYPSSCYCDFSLETLYCRKTRTRKVWLLSSGG